DGAGDRCPGKSYRRHARTWRGLRRGRVALSAQQQEVFDHGIEIEDIAVAELKAAGLSQNRALGLLGVSKSAWHYRTRPRPRVADPVAHRYRSHPAKLSDVEYETVANLLRESD